METSKSTLPINRPEPGPQFLRQFEEPIQEEPVQGDEPLGCASVVVLAWVMVMILTWVTAMLTILTPSP